MNNLELLDNHLLKQNGKIIHQVWFGVIPNKKKAKKDYEKLKKYRDSWIEKNPGWYRYEWDKKTSLSFITKFFPQHLDLYIQYPYEIQRCDMVRYCILYRYGGLYADMDYFCNKPFDLALSVYRDNFYLVQTPNMVGEFVSNSLMYCKAGNPFWLSLLIEMEKSKETPIYYNQHLTIMYASGPGIVNRVYHKYKKRYKLKSFPHKYFQPYSQTHDIVSLKNKNVFTTHATKGCWHSKDTMFIVVFLKNWKLFALLFLFIMVNIILVS